MDEKVEAIFGYIQERCLWQFFSRNKDRERNINGILTNLYTLFCGNEVPKDTNLDKCYYADAKILFSQLEEKFPWFTEMNSKEMHELTEKVKAKLIDLAVTNSLNAERTLDYY